MTPAPEEAPLRRAPIVLEADPAGLPQAEHLATPEVRTLLGYTRRILHLPDGHTLAVFSFGIRDGNRLFLIDTRDLSVEWFPAPDGRHISHGAALGADNALYFMPYGDGRAYRFDLERKVFSRIQVDLPVTEYVWDALGTADGRVYFGTYPNAYFGVYIIATGETRTWPNAVRDATTLQWLSHDRGGRIGFRATGPADVRMTFDPATGAIEPAEAPPPTRNAPTPPGPVWPGVPEGDQRFVQSKITEGRRFFISFPTSRLWEADDAGVLTLRGEPGSPAEMWYLEAVSGALVGVSHFGHVFRYDLDTGAVLQEQMPNRTPGGNSIMFLAAVTPRSVIGANYSQQNLWDLDPETGDISQADTMIARVTGEPMCAVGCGGRAYIGVYVDSLIMEYDPQRPIVFADNPRELIELGATYRQTRPRAAVTDGTLVYISSDSAYNTLGGALAVIDPRTGAVDVYHHLIRDQNLPSLAWDPQRELLWGGTDRWGQMRTHDPTQDSSLIYAFDPETRRVVSTLKPWPGADLTTVLGCSANGVLVATSGDELALIDTSTREVLFRGTPASGVPGTLVPGSDGYTYTLLKDILYRWDLERNVMEPVASAPGCVHLTEPSPGLWVVGHSASVYRVRLEEAGRGDN